MLYSLLGRLTWGIVKRRIRRRRPQTRHPLLAALITAGALVASYRTQGHRRASRR